jgi:hypothetical protein
MKGLKLSPFMIFLMMLLVLVILVALYNYFSPDQPWSAKEGFIQLYNDKQINDAVILPMYSPQNNVLKLYDNLFFDNRNGNLIEIVDEIDTSASQTVVTIYVTTRAGITTIYGNNTRVVPAESSIPSTKSSYVSWVYNTFSKKTDTYSVAYIPWGTSTYIHIINTTHPTTMQTYMFMENGNMNHSPITIPATLSGVGNDTDAKNNTMVSDIVYGINLPVYQISKNVKYDLSSGNLVVDLSSGIVVYDNQGNSTTYDSKKTKISMENSRGGSGYFSPWATIDSNGQTLVVYMHSEKATVIVSLRISNSTNTPLYTLGNVCRFGPNGIDNGNGSATIIQLNSPSSAKSSSNMDTMGPVDSGIQISLDNQGVNISASNNAIFSYLMTFLKSAPMGMPGSGADAGSLPNFTQNSDYILKTQIVPPVCPSCPACNLSLGNVCSNCGGQGGSGTLTCNGTSVIDACGNIILDKNGKPTACTAPAGTAVSISKDGVLQSSTTGPVSGVANNLINTTGNVITGTESNAVGLLQNAGSGASNLAKSAAIGTTTAVSNTLSETKNLLEDTGKGVKGFVEDTGLGVKGLLEETGSGLSKIFTPRATYVAGNSGMIGGGYSVPSRGPSSIGYGTAMQGTAMQGTAMHGTNTQYTDPYSYSGMLPAKSPSNYMPITADFSAFGK